MDKTNIIVEQSTGVQVDAAIEELVKEFALVCEPLERTALYLLQDLRTGARYVECHIRADKLVELGTVDVPLDPDEQPEYRANRERVEDHVAFEKMKEDALARRTFSNIVAEFSREYDKEHPVKIIGGQHRFYAIEQALKDQVNEYHGIKIYFNLDLEQRLDVQLISNTNIAVSTDLFDRMQETQSGPELRKWCQAVGLLGPSEDFADKRARSNPLTVRAARTFVLNYLRGRALDATKFDELETTPAICASGIQDDEWELLKKNTPTVWTDVGLREAAMAFAALVLAQRSAFAPKKDGKKGSVNIDFSEKAMNFAVLSSWAFTAGILQSNPVRLARHYALKDQTGRDPLNASALAKGKHKSDPENYRGLGYRTDPKERGRLTELMFAQAEDGKGITSPMIDLAIKKYHAKEAHLEVLKATQKAK